MGLLMSAALAHIDVPVFGTMEAQECSGAAATARSVTDTTGGADMAERTCFVEGCSKDVWRRVWCQGHYARWRRYGDPEALGTLRRKALPWLERAISAALLSDDDSCLSTWPFERNEHGYPRLWDGKRGRYAHHVVLELTGRRKPGPGFQARHLCGNGHLGCLHPRHLAWGTPADNTADKMRHGTCARGTRHGSAKLTEADVVAIRQSTEPNKALAARYGLSHSTVSNIISRKIWGWL